ncbi:MAG: phosphatidylinositol-specific phospholipase C1-like protein [Rhizomicrobium sp.]
MRILVSAIAALLLSGGAALADCDLAALDAKAAGPGCARAWMDKNLRLNDIVTVGTHNSYKMAIPPRLMSLVRMGSAEAARGLDYAHLPLAQQLDDGARAIEIDVVYDPDGYLYAHPAGAAMTGEVMPDDWLKAMKKPGFKVLHVQDIDFHAVCITFIACLQDLKTWSKAHPDHVPILVTLNAKDDTIAMPGAVTPLKFDTAAFDALDAELLSVFSPDELVTPSAVQGGAPSLREAILAKGWPTLGETRGKFLFALDETGAKAAAYIGGRKALEGRAMFVTVPEDSPAAAFLVLNETSDMARIGQDVAQNFLVRTRADADTVEARDNNAARRDAALASGAQYISTDYMRPDTRFGPYQARMPRRRHCRLQSAAASRALRGIAGGVRIPRMVRAFCVAAPSAVLSKMHQTSLPASRAALRRAASAASASGV